MQLTEEIMSDEFTKYHIKGLPFDAVLHKFTAINDEHPHDHPFGFTTHILKGGYIERVYYITDGNWYSARIHRKPGTAHRVEATHIHQIIELPEGECWTLILPEKWERECRFWKFTENGIMYRQWNETEFTHYQQSLI